MYNMLRSNWMRSQKDYCIILISQQSKWKDLTIELEHHKTNNMTCVPSEGSAQPGHLPSQLRAFTVRFMDSWKDLILIHADSENSDQTGWMPRLISIFARPHVSLVILPCIGSNDKMASCWMSWSVERLRHNMLCTKVHNNGCCWNQQNKLCDKQQWNLW